MPTTLIDLATLACQKVGKSDADTITLAKKFTQQRYLMIYDSALWSDSQILYSTSTNTDSVILPHYIDRIVAVRSGGSSNLPQTELGSLFQADPTIFERTGEQVTYSELPPIAVSVLPASAGILSMSSDSTADTGISVRIRGDLSGLESREIVSLSGLTTVSTSKIYDTPYVISKPLTSGTITVLDSANNVLVTLSPDEYERRHTRLRLHSAPSSGSVNLLILAKRKPRPLTDDLDTPTIRNVENALLSFVTADLLEALRQYGKAQAKVTEAGSLLAEARDMEKNQAQKTVRIIPEASGEWTRDDWSGSFASTL